MLHLSLIANFLTALNQVERRHRLDSHHLPNITTFLFNFFANLQENLSPRTALESVYPDVFPHTMERFFLCYGDETPGSVKPSGEHGSCFGGGSSECSAQGNVQALSGICRALPFLTQPCFGGGSAEWFAQGNG